MRYPDRTLAGLSFFTGAVAYLILTLVAETAYPGYLTSTRAISDLGVGPTAAIWTAGLIVVGLLTLFGSYLIYRSERLRLLPILLALAAAGALGVAGVNENMGPLHLVFALLAFTSLGLGAIFSYPLVKPPLRYGFIGLGLLGLASLVSYLTAYYIPGGGGVERMIVLPGLLFLLAFGAYLMAAPSTATSAAPTA